MSAEAAMLPAIEEYFQSRGWKVSRETRIRGRSADLLAVKDGEILAVEVKGGAGSIEKGLMQALHQKQAVDLSYLAIPEERISSKTSGVCKALGMGLLVFGRHGVREVIMPLKGRALPSVRAAVFKKKPQVKTVLAKSALEYLFRTKTQILVLKLFFLNPGSELHVNEIARRTGLAPSSVTKEMKRMENVGIVTRKEQGNLVLYRINTGSIIFDELKRIFLKYELVDEIIASKLPREKIRYALIFGSFAKGVERETSDIDLFVVGRVSDEELLEVVGKIEGRVGREINYIRWTEDEFKMKVKEKVSLLANIAKDRIIMIVGEEDEFRQAIK